MGKRSCFYYVGALILLLSRCGLQAAATPHYVFAHYMVCFATYGQTIDGYKREIQEAQAAGIDGFRAQRRRVGQRSNSTTSNASS